MITYSIGDTMDTTQWLSDTRRVIEIGNGYLAVYIKKDIAEALEIKKGLLVELKIRNTGIEAPADIRKKKETESTE